jgi:hypothetical protein
VSHINQLIDEENLNRCIMQDSVTVHIENHSVDALDEVFSEWVIRIVAFMITQI